MTPFKTCNQNCVFCQLGRTKNPTVIRKEYVPLGEVLEELGEWLRRDGKADHITLSGSGEPTLHSRFGEVLRFVREKSEIKAVLLTNGSLLHLPEVRSSASQAHVVKVSLSAWDQSSFRLINRPDSRIKFEHVVEGLRTFRAQFAGQMWMEVFLVAGMNATPAEVAKIAALAEKIGPDRIHLNTAVRPPSEDFVSPLSADRLASLVHLFRPTAEVIAEFEVQGDVEMEANQEEILSLLQRRPCKAEEIAETFGLHLNEVLKYLVALTKAGRIRAEGTGGSLYYMGAKREQVVLHPSGNAPAFKEVRKDPIQNTRG